MKYILLYLGSIINTSSILGSVGITGIFYINK